MISCFLEVHYSRKTCIFVASKVLTWLPKTEFINVFTQSTWQQVRFNLHQMFTNEIPSQQALTGHKIKTVLVSWSLKYIYASYHMLIMKMFWVIWLAVYHIVIDIKYVSSIRASFLGFSTIYMIRFFSWGNKTRGVVYPARSL